jgi:hypothetical protein
MDVSAGLCPIRQRRIVTVNPRLASRQPAHRANKAGLRAAISRGREGAADVLGRGASGSPAVPMTGSPRAMRPAEAELRSSRLMVEGRAVQVTDNDTLRRLAEAWVMKWDGRWRFEVGEDCFLHSGGHRASTGIRGHARQDADLRQGKQRRPPDPRRRHRPNWWKPAVDGRPRGRRSAASAPPA